jgi:hypothetical protein
VPANTTDHQLRIKADARQVKDAGKIIKDAFSPRHLKDFGKEAQLIEKQLGQLTDQQNKLVKALQNTRRGSDEYKRLNRELKDVERQAKRTQTALERAGEWTDARGRRRNARGQFLGGGGGGAAGAGGGGGGGGRGSFWAGAAQGLGIAQYIPTGPGMARRIGGAALGGMMRRGIGGAAAPFMMPGIGGLSQMMGAIPIFGGLAQGALSSMQGWYGQAVGYQTAARGALFAQGAGLSPGEMRMRRRRFEAAARRLERGLPMTEVPEQEVLRRRETMARERPRPVPAGGGRTGATSMAARFGQPAATVAEDIITPELASPERIRAEWDKELRRRGRSMRPSRETEDSERRRRIQRIKDRAAALRSMGKRQPTGLPGAGAGAEFGLMPQEMMQGFTQFMMARGGTYDDVRRSAFRQQMAAQVRYGVGPQLAGQFARMGVAGGGGRGGMDLATVLQTGVEAGLRGSQVQEYLQTLVQLGQQAEQRGVKIDERSFTATAAMMRGLGLRGPQVGRVAAGFQRAGMSLAERGVQGARDLMLLRAAGFRPGQGRVGYIKALKRAQTDPAFLARNLMQEISGSLQGVQGRTPEETGLRRQFQLIRALGAARIPIGFEQAEEMLSRMEGGQFAPETVAEIQQRITRGRRAGAGGRLGAAARGGVRRGAPILPGAAGIQAAQIGVGAEMAGTIQALEKVGIQNVRILGNFNKQIRIVTDAMMTLSQELTKLTKGDVMENLSKLFKRLVIGSP